MAAPTATSPRRRNPPFLPTPLESAVLAAYPAILVFGALFSLVSPQTRAAPFDHVTQAHTQDPSLAPSYFARKDNLFNVFFVKRGWGWISAAFLFFVATHPAFSAARPRLGRGGAVLRWALVTGWWVLVTQWCFGPALIDRGFRFTGGSCEVVMERVEEGRARGGGDVFTAAACRAVGGRWSGGHDISGHVFLLVLGSFFLLQEVGWVVRRFGAGVTRGEGEMEERTVVMGDGAVKGAGVEAGHSAAATGAAGDVLGIAGKFAGAVVVLCWWMLLMTAIYFHTWFEKVSLSPRLRLV